MTLRALLAEWLLAWKGYEADTRLEALRLLLDSAPSRPDLREGERAGGRPDGWRVGRRDLFP